MRLPKPRGLGAITAMLGALAASFPPARAAEGPTEAEIGVEQVYLTLDQALSEIFPEAAARDTVVAVLRPEEQDELHRRLGRPAPGDTVVVYRLRDAEGRVAGHAMVAEEVGKYRPFTFVVGVSPELRVRNVEVLVYRESRGGEIRRTRFLRQYREKGPADPIRLNRDILNIAGATMSVNAMNLGVKRVLSTLELLAARNAL